MIKTDLLLPYGYTGDSLKEAIASHLPVGKDEIKEARILRRELIVKDGKTPVYKSTVAFLSDIEKEEGLLKIRNKVTRYYEEEFAPPMSDFKSRPLVVGAGPAGLFAALTLAESGARPILIERGLEVNERKKKIELFRKLGVLDTECNVQFGEGGAGTYSDGKLKTGARDKYKLKVLYEFIDGGADETIAYSTSAHLGTDRLSGIIESIRNKITSLGGELVFSAKLTDLIIREGRLARAVYEKNGETVTVETDTLILATGHSARDTFGMLYEKGIPMSAKGFGIGMRIEHPREYINGIVYKGAAKQISESASYHLVTHLPSGRSVYSFCMCPGGEVVMATSEEGAIVTNGMSEYSRSADNSNAAILVSVTPSDFASDDPLSGIELQKKIERAAYGISSSYKAPAIRLDELMSGGKNCEPCSVKPSYPLGVIDAHPDEYMPNYISSSIKEAMSDFDSWLNGYMYNDAVLTGPETRTTSPVRIERNDGGCSPVCEGIYPTGEGAGYAGGIISSATDGIKMAEKAILKHLKRQ